MYLVWRRLGISIDEWTSLPWWQQQVVLDGLEWEAEENTGDGDGSSKAGQEAEITEMEKFEALTKSGSTRKKGFGGAKS